MRTLAESMNELCKSTPGVVQNGPKWVGARRF